MLAPTPCYSRNLEALRAFQPEVAAAVDAAPVCEGVAQTTARDGSNTYLIPGEGSRPIWFGASSMPTISASEIFADFYSDGRSVWLPGVFTGVEPLVVAGRMPSHAALFVVERNLSYVKLAMHLHDYVELLAAGRLVFIPGDGEELVDGLSKFFEHHPGYELPVHLLSGPQLSAVQVADLGCRLETAGRAAAAVQAPIVEAHVQRIRARSFAQLSSSPRVAVLSVDPGPVSLEQAGRIGRALTALGWSHELCIPDAPDKCHIAARLQTIERLSADLVLFVNGTAGPMNPLLPEDLPVACWYLPGANVQSLQASGPDGRHMIFASSQALHDALVRAGVPAGGIEHCGPAADETTYRAVELSSGDRGALEADVAAIMDLPDDRPEACNVNLASHVALWHALRKAATRNADRYHSGIAEELLVEAQHESGTNLKDPKVREHFVALVKARIGPAAVARAAVKVLLARGCRVAVWGRNWSPPDYRLESRSHKQPESLSHKVESGSLAREPVLVPQWERDGNLAPVAPDRKIWRGLMPVGDALNRLFNAVGIVLLPDSSACAVQTALDAIAAGAHVVFRRADKPFEQAYPALKDLTPFLHFYRTSAELLDMVRRLSVQRKAPENHVDPARTLVMREHTVAKRLLAIVETARRRRAPAMQTH